VGTLVNGKGIPDPPLAAFEPDLLTDPRLRAIFRVVLEQRKNGEPLDFPSAATHLSDEDQRILFSELACDEEETGDPEAISSYISYLTRAFLERQAAAVQQEIVAAQASGDKEEIDRLFRSKTALKQQIADLGRESARRKNC
jgi:replicative DNA helicase